MQPRFELPKSRGLILVLFAIGFVNLFAWWSDLSKYHLLSLRSLVSLTTSAVCFTLGTEHWLRLAQQPMARVFRYVSLTLTCVGIALLIALFLTR